MSGKDILEGMDYQCQTADSQPKYRQIANALMAFLRASRTPSDSKLPNDKELARRFNVALMTMSRALNELASRGILERRVGAGTFVRSLTGKKSLISRRVAIVCHEPITMEGGFVTSLLPEFYRKAPEYHLDLMQLQRSPAEYAETIREFQLSGIIVLSAEENFLPELARMAAEGVNVVQLGMWHRQYREFSFGTDHTAVAKMAVKYLYGLGHRKIGFLSSSTIEGKVHQSTSERIAGYQRALWELKQPFNPSWIVHCENSSTDIAEKFRELIAQEEMPTAFLLSSLPWAPRIYHAIQSLGLTIPEDVSLVAFDESALCGQLVPGLTTFSQNIPTLVENVLEHLTNPGGKVSMTPVSPKLIERGSCRVMEES